MKTLVLLSSVALLSACGGSTDTKAARYNFAVIDGKNQASAAGTATLARPITSQLTRDPQGQFASRVFDFLAPEKAYAQGISLSGDPVADAIVCGRVAPVDEPQVVPLCAFTLADGKAANVVQPGTKAGTYSVLFTAQVPTQEPVVDSTTVVVQAGPVTVNGYSTGVRIGGESPLVVDNGPGDALLTDAYRNQVPYRLAPSDFVHAVSDTLGALSSRTLVADKDGQGTVDVVTASGMVATGKITVTGTGTASSVIQLDFISSK